LRRGPRNHRAPAALSGGAASILLLATALAQAAPGDPPPASGEPPPGSPVSAPDETSPGSLGRGALSPEVSAGELPPPVAPVAAAASRSPPPPPSVPVVIPTADAQPAASDHDAVVGRWGVEARRVAAPRYPLALRPGRGCPMANGTTPCTLEMGALGVRYWRSRNLALNAGLALAVGGGREGNRALDTYVGGGPLLGLTLLLGNWKHLAVGATPELSVMIFKPGGSTTERTTLIDLRASLEGELHFGFVGVPALSIGVTSGLVFHYEKTPAVRVWSIGFGGASSVWGALTNLFIRYYL
jgi:hypothetical protein